MPRLHVCSLARIGPMVEETGARSLVTLMSNAKQVTRPEVIHVDRHLVIEVGDIVAETDGHVLPQAAHLETLLAFVRGWDRKTPLLIHCFAGVSRSTAAAFTVACALSPHVAEAEFARRIRVASPTATPNARMVELADALLRRDGRMTAAVAGIGRGVDCFEGVPFALELD